MITPDDFRAIRLKVGYRQADWAIVLGYRSASRQNLSQQISDIEGGRKPITPQLSRLVLMLNRFGIPDDFNNPEAPEQ